MKILMVCLGNICRSPLAEGILRIKASANGLKLELDSAGTSSHHKGEQPDKRSIASASKYGVAISSLKARPFEKIDFEHFDRIYVMDRSIRKEVLSRTNLKEHKNKVILFLDELYPGEEKDVPDPYYGTEADFDEVYQLINAACDKIIASLKMQLL